MIKIMINDKEITKDNISLLIPCLPLSLYHKPVKDQPGPKKENCPVCEEKIWSSTWKRGKRRKNGCILVCHFCLFSIMYAFGIDPRYVTLIKKSEIN
jgi:hypothetical protein